MSVLARFWFAPGIEVFPGISVPTPPPLSYRFAIREPLSLRECSASPSAFVVPQTAEFRLGEHSEHVAHYDLDAKPRAGWRWLAVDGAIRAERIA